MKSTKNKQFLNLFFSCLLLALIFYLPFVSSLPPVYNYTYTTIPESYGNTTTYDGYSIDLACYEDLDFDRGEFTDYYYLSYYDEYNENCAYFTIGYATINAEFYEVAFTSEGSPASPLLYYSTYPVGDDVNFGQSVYYCSSEFSGNRTSEYGLISPCTEANYETYFGDCSAELFFNITVLNSGGSPSPAEEFYPTCRDWDVSSNITSFWKLDETTGLMLDEYGRYNATVYNLTRGVTGVFNYSYSFDGLDDYVNTTVPLEAGSNFSFSAWVKPAKLAPTTGPAVFSSGTLDTWFGMISSNKLRFHIDSVSNYVDTDNAIFNSTSDWLHLVLVWNGSQPAIYVNSVLQSYATYGTMQDFDSSYLTLGTYLGSVNYWNGSIDHVKLFGYPLSSSDVTTLYQEYSSDAINWTANISNQTMDFYDYLEINISDYVTDNWYDLAVVYADPITSNSSVLITSYGDVNSDFYDFYLGASGYTSNLSVFSYDDFENLQIDVFACDDDPLGIDDFCPLIGFPSTCNISAFYDTEYCIQQTFFLNISGNYTVAVNQTNSFSLYYPLDYPDNESFSMSYYFANYANISVNWIDPLASNTTNRTLACVFQDGNISSLTGVLNVTLNCSSLSSTVWLDIYSNNITYNTTFFVSASNSNNSITDYFIVSTGSDYSSSDVNYTNPINTSSFCSFCPGTGDNTTDSLIILIFLLSVSAFLIVFVCLPLAFSKFALFISSLLLWFFVLFLAKCEAVSWSWVIIPAILFILYFLITKFFGGSS
jgi:hypothetical protein